VIIFSGISYEMPNMELEADAGWLDDVINETITEDKNLVDKCCSIASGEYY
jgi:hypothetical protein